MKLISFLLKSDPTILRIGAIHNKYVIDFSSTNLPKDMINFIKMGTKGLDIANDHIHTCKNKYDVNEAALVLYDTAKTEWCVRHGDKPCPRIIAPLEFIFEGDIYAETF